MRRSWFAIATSTLLGALAGSLLATAPAAASATAADTPASRAPGVDLVKVEGVIDPALVDYVRGTIEESERHGDTVVLQIDSRGSYGDLAEGLARFIRSATVPVVAWIGPSGTRAAGGSLFAVYGSGLVAMAPGAGLGPARPFDLGTSTSREEPSTVARRSDALVSLAAGAGAAAAGVRSVVSGPPIAAGPAQARGAVSLIAVDVSDLLQRLDGRTVRAATGHVALVTANRPGRPVTVRFHEIGPLRRVLHGVSTPTAVYVLLVLGMWGIAFELTQPGVGVAGIAGGAAVALAVYGLAIVPFHWLGLGLLAGGTALQGLDVVARRVAFLTAAGTVAFAAGSVLTWYGVAPAVDLSLWVIVLFTVAGLLFFGFALTVALRSRQRVKEAQVGLVGLVGEVRTDLDPEGGVYVKGALWRARSGNGPIPKGTRVRVRGLDGLILRVEQEPDQP